MAYPISRSSIPAVRLTVAAGYASVAVLIGNGDGSFQAPVLYATGSYEPMSLATGDFNGDGVPDLVVASQCASVSLRSRPGERALGNGDGTFQSPVSYRPAPAAATSWRPGDFNGDGNLDLAVANQTSANSVIAFCWATATAPSRRLSVTQPGAASAQFLAVADFNSDGAPIWRWPTAGRRIR
jgi:hypothetical protein